MRTYRIVTILGPCAGAALFLGCSAALQPDGGATSGSSIVQVEHDFSGAKELAVITRAVTYESGQMLLEGEVLPGSEGGVALVLSSDDLIIKVDDTLDYDARSAKRPSERHVELTFRVGRSQQEACDSGVHFGPVEVTVSDAGVTIVQASLPLHPAAAAIVRSGKFGACAETWGDFDGSANLGRVRFEFTNKQSEDGFVEICHVPPGDPDNRHTVTIGASAVERHLAHGDSLGPCESAEDDPDSDGDGVTDLVDECPDTPSDVEVYPNGCTVIVLAADAGPDRDVVEGDAVSVSATAELLQGEYDPANLVYAWEQIAGMPVPYESNGPLLSVDTWGGEGVVVFLLTVSTDDGLASSSDEVAINIMPAQVVQVAAGKWHNVAIFENGRMAPWGTNRYGQLGDGTVVHSISHVGAGPTATLFSQQDGTAWSVGVNALSDSATPVEILGIPGVVNVAAQSAGGLLLGSDATVWGFGDARNLHCELAGEPYADAVGVLGPLQIPGLPDEVVAVSAGNAHGVALDAEGVAWVWGSRFGCTPMPVLDNVVAVDAGDSAYCLLLRGDGSAWGVGYNSFGQLGNGTRTSNFNTATQVVGLGDVVEVAAGYAHSFFVTSDGALWATGWNRYCQLGLEDEVSPAVPVFGDVVTEPVLVGLPDIASVAAGYLHSVAVQTDGTVWAWGSDGTGQLSTGTLTDLPPVVCTPMELTLDDP